MPSSTIKLMVHEMRNYENAGKYKAISSVAITQAPKKLIFNQTEYVEMHERLMDKETI